MAKAFHGDPGMIFSLLMLVNLQTIFAMLSLCYAQCPNYLFRIMFPSLGILKHYAKSDTNTIVTLKNLFNAGFFGGSIGHLARHQAIFLIF